MMGCNYDRLLQSLCGPGDGRLITQNPWLVAIGGQTYAAATDGVRALYLVTDGANAIPGAEHLRNKYEPCPMPHLANLLVKVPAPTHQIDHSALLAAIGPGSVVFWEWGWCPRCGGGRCGYCGNEGEMWQRSDFGRADPLLIGGLPHAVDAHLARGIFEQLPDDPILLSSIPGMVAFLGAGYALLVAPFDLRNTPLTRHIEAVRIQWAEPSA